MKSILANSILSSAQAREVDLSFNYANKLPKGSKFVVETMDECCIDWATATDATTNTALPRLSHFLEPPPNVKWQQCQPPKTSLENTFTEQFGDLDPTGQVLSE